MAASAQAVLDVARSQIGYREGPNNDTKYGAWYGLNNQPWCAMFVSWCAAQVSALDIIPKHAWTPAGAQWFQQQGRWGGAPQSGAIVYFDFPGGFNGVEHVGIVETVEGDGSVVTIEGNTNNNGSGNGDGVYRMRRRSSIVGYGYPAYAAGSPPPATAAPGYRQGGRVYRSKMWRGQTYSDSVWNLQTALIARGFGIPAGPTGNYLDQTVAACAAAQRAQGFTGADAEGIAGPTAVRWH